MALQVQASTEFKASNFTFSNVRKNKMGGKVVYLNYGSSKTFIQLPSMRAPFGLSSYTDEATKKTTYSLDLSFDAENNDFLEKMVELDELIISTVQKNSKEWLGKFYNEGVIREALYKPVVKAPSKPEYPSTMKLKILTKSDGGFVPEAYNYKRQSVELDSLEKGQKVISIVDFNQIWFIDNKFGVSVRLHQVLFEPSKKLPTFAFTGIAEPEEDEEEEEVEYEEVEVDEP